MPIGPEDLSGGERKLFDRVLLLLVGYDGRAMVDKERVVGIEEAAPITSRRGRGEPPNDSLGAVEQQQTVVTPIGDQQLTAEIRGARPGRAGGPKGGVGGHHL